MPLSFNTGTTTRWLGGVAAVSLTTALLVAANATETSAGLIFLVLVVWLATQAGLAISLFSATLCAGAFDYFFLPPIHRFRLAGTQEWVGMIAFLASSLVAGRVAERARRQARQAQQRREDVERLYLLSQEMMLHEDAAGLKGELPRMIQRIFALDDVVLYSGDDEAIFSSVTGDAELPMSVQASLSAVSQGMSPTLALPGAMTAMPLMVGMRAVGALGWRPSKLSRELGTAITAQVAIAVTRAVAIEASARLEASREGERLRTALIDSLTHELRTPLTSIRAAATTLTQGEGLDDAARLDLAAIVDEESARLDALIGEAVEMAEIDANVVKVHASPQHTHTLLEHAVEKSQAVLAPHRVAISVQGPDAPVWLDPHLLERVFRHLLENAARYCPPGSRIVLRSWRSADRVEFSVEDNGPGIDPADLPLIFEKFYRGKNSGSKGKGTGMGLAIARAILNAHGGSIEVSSSPVQGTTFRFWVPLVEKEAI
jgi:two-component system, OmpR family, sensor histidine kinase KdpD